MEQPLACPLLGKPQKGEDTLDLGKAHDLNFQFIVFRTKVIMCNGQLRQADFAKLFFEFKKAPSTDAAGSREDQGQEIFIISETHITERLLVSNK